MAFAVKGLRKAYGGVEVLKGVDFAVADGEIHALLGANGAGKSTLIKCLSGAIVPDAGDIILGDHVYRSLTPKESRKAGIAVVYQEPSLAMSLDAADNIFLGREIRSGPLVRKRAQRRETARRLADFGVGIAPTADLGSLGNAELQAIEIVKALVSDPKVLILDEPTASLSERDAELLQAQLLGLRKQNLPVLYVTHRLGEVFTLADRVTVLRGGEVVLTARVADVTHDELVHAIIGTGIVRARSAARPASTPLGVPLLNVVDLLAAGIGPVTFDVGPGEVLGVFGLVGSGRTELLETLFGAHPRHGGVVHLEGKPIAPRHPVDAVVEGIALVPSDRLRKSILAPLPSADNLLMSALRQIGRAGFRRNRREGVVFEAIAARLNLQPRRADLEARRFSGGNQQKLVLGRWMNDANNCHLLLLDEPTQGVDVGARREIYQALRAFAASEDKAVIMTSSEPEELMQVADRVIVLAGGRIAGVLVGPEIVEGRLLALAHQLEKREAA